MATYTTAQMSASGVYPAGTDVAGFPSFVVITYDLDFSKKTLANADVIQLWDIPAGTAISVFGASVDVTAATGITAAAIGLNGSAITGLTAINLNAVAKVVQYASAANTTTGAASNLSLTLTTGTPNATGKVRVRVFAIVI